MPTIRQPSNQRIESSAEIQLIDLLHGTCSIDKKTPHKQFTKW